MKAGLVLKDEFDKPVWATPDSYIARNMLLAFIEEVGNEDESFMLGASCRKGNNRNALVDMATAQKASKGMRRRIVKTRTRSSRETVKLRFSLFLSTE